MGCQNINGHHFYAGLLKNGSIVVDLGAGKGEFVEKLNNLISCRSYAVEANPDLCREIKETTSARKFNYAITGSGGETKFYIPDRLDAASIYSQIASQGGGAINKTLAVSSITFEKLLSQNNIKNIDVLKIDIEGAEIVLFDSIKDSTLADIKQITVEFHDFLDKELSLGVKRIIRRLKRIGFLVIRNKALALNADILFINKDIFRGFDVRYLYFFMLDVLSLKYIFLARKAFNKIIMFTQTLLKR